MKSERKCSVPFSPPFSLSLGLFFSPVFCFVAEAGIEKVARRRVNVDAMALNEGTHTKTNSPTILQTPRDLRQVETSFSDRKLADRFTSFWKMFPTQPRRFVVCPVLVCFYCFARELLVRTDTCLVRQLFAERVSQSPARLLS